MSTINGKACVVNGTPVDKVFSNGKQVYGQNLFATSSSVSGYVDASGNGIYMTTKYGVLASDYVSVVGYNRLVYQSWVDWTDDRNVAQDWIGWAFFDNDKKLVGGRTASNGDAHTVGDTAYNARYIDVPEGAAFIRISARWLDGVDAKYKLEAGNVATAWTPAPEDVV